MITELRVRDLAVVRDVSLTFSAGLNVMTGETGAGKSILVDALALLLGARATADVVRTGQRHAIVEGVFDVGDRPDVTTAAEELGLDAGDGFLVIKREVAGQGRSRAWVNGSPTTAGVLHRLGTLLVDLHGQHETQSLLRPDAQRDLLDAFADALEERARLAAAFEVVRDLERDREHLGARRDEALRRADYLRHVVEEIDGAKLVAGEDESVDIEINRLSNAEELGQLASAVADGVDDDDRGLRAALDRVAREHAHLEKLDSATASWREWLDTIYAHLDELASAARDYSESIDHDPERLEMLERRRSLIFDLTRKYGSTVESVMETADSARAELELLASADHDLSALDTRLAGARASLHTAAQALTKKRRSAGERLGHQVSGILPELGLPDGSLRVRCETLPTVEANGAERVAFDVALNAGLEHRPLAKVASGGELSRIMLALKAVLAREDATPTLIFDEVDQGVGGEVGSGVGKYLAQVAGTHQVLVITHLPQIAARGSRHLVVAKGREDGVATADVTVADGDRRVEELARMLGDAGGDTARSHARELLTRSVPAPVRPRAQNTVAG